MEKKKNTSANIPISYTDAFNELQLLVKDMENAEINVDELAEKIRRCNFLIRICKDKLSKTEEEIASLIANDR